MIIIIKKTTTKPHLQLNLCVAVLRLRVRDAHRRGLAGDALYGAHEDVGDVRHAKEEPQQGDQVEERPYSRGPGVLVQGRQQEEALGAGVVVDIDDLAIWVVVDG